MASINLLRTSKRVFVSFRRFLQNPFDDISESNRIRKGFVGYEVLQMVWDRVYEDMENSAMRVCRLTTKFNSDISRASPIRAS